MHHAGLLLLVLVALLLLGPLMLQGLSVAGSVVAQIGLAMEEVVGLANLSAVTAVLAVVVAGLLVVAILRLTLGV